MTNYSQGSESACGSDATPRPHDSATPGAAASEAARRGSDPAATVGVTTTQPTTAFTSLADDARRAAHDFVLAVLSDDRQAAADAVGGQSPGALMLTLTAMLIQLADETVGISALRETISLSAHELDLAG